MLKIAFQGDYSREFGGQSRKWKTYQLLNKNKEIIGMIEQEPEDYFYRFKAYKSNCVIGGNYVGQFQTRKEAIIVLKKWTKNIKTKQ